MREMTWRGSWMATRRAVLTGGSGSGEDGVAEVGVSADIGDDFTPGPVPEMGPTSSMSCAGRLAPWW